MSFILWPNIILCVCLGVVLGILGFIIYGFIVGYENTLKTFENNVNQPTEQKEHIV